MSPPNRHHRTGILLGFLVSGMVGLSFAAVPLYRLFCQKTGFGGTIQRAMAPAPSSSAPCNRHLTIRFNADVHRDLPWAFWPTETKKVIRVGENAMTYYESENKSQEWITGMATYNVTPDKAGIYFHKVHCFCFDEQVLKPQERIQMPVLFFIDPAFASDPAMSDVHTLTLSYTFFRIHRR